MMNVAMVSLLPTSFNRFSNQKVYYGSISRDSTNLSNFWSFDFQTRNIICDRYASQIFLTCQQMRTNNSCGKNVVINILYRKCIYLFLLILLSIFFVSFFLIAVFVIIILLIKFAKCKWNRNHELLTHCQTKRKRDGEKESNRKPM